MWGPRLRCDEGFVDWLLVVRRLCAERVQPPMAETDVLGLGCASTLTASRGLVQPSFARSFVGWLFVTSAAAGAAGSRLCRSVAFALG